MAGISGSLVAAGFDAAVLEELPQPSRARLARVAVLRQLAFLAVALAAGAAAVISMHGGWTGWLAAAVTAVAVWLLLSAMGRLVVSAGGPGVIRGIAAAEAWRPGVLWPAFMLAVGLLAAQPILLVLGWGGSEQRLDASVDGRVALNLSRQRDLMLAGDNGLQLERARYSERLATGGAPPPADSRRRKALVIGAQEYRHAGRLNNPAKDARDLAAKLEAMGFAVAVSVDETGDALQASIDRHIRSLKPGDISVLVYSGHGYQQDGHNYIVPVDFDGRRVGGIRVTRILEAIDRRAPQLQVILLDACRSFESDGFRASTGGLAELQGGSNSFIAMAAQPGKEALDGPRGSNGVFTEAILRHIDRPEDINVLFRRISADVTAGAGKRGFRQEPVVTSTLQSEYVQLVDPAVAAPQSLLRGAIGMTVAATAERAGAPPPPEVCPPPSGFPPEQQQAAVRGCLQARIAAIDAALADWRAVGPGVLRGNADDHRRSLRASGLFTERLRDLWATAPAWLALLTALIAAGFVAGESLNWLYRRDMADYFVRRNRHAVRLLDRSHRRAEAALEERLAGVRHPSYRDLEPFRTAFDWRGPVDPAPLWSGDAPTPTRPQRAAIDAWLRRAVPSTGGTR